MDRFAAMQAYIAVVEAGSFVGASERLGTSTTTVSRLVSELEAHLQVRLLQRTTRRLSLTDAGRTYYQQAQALLDELAETEAAISRDAVAASGVLRVSAPVSFGIQHLGPLLPDFHEQHPRVRVELSLNDRIVDLVDQGQDVAIRITEQLAGSLVARPLAPVRLVICASPQYLQRHGTPRTPEELAGHQCLLYSYTERPSSWTLAGPSGPGSVSVDGFLTANNGDVLRKAALAGAGIIRQPSFIVGEDLAAGRLIPLLCDYAPAPLTACAVYPSRRHLSAKVRAFIDFLAGAWGDPPPWDAWLDVRLS